MVNEGASPPKLHGWLLMALGLPAVVLGAVWTLQGLDILPYGVMRGQRVWAVIGPAVMLGGLILIVVGVRRRSAAKG